MPKSKVLVIEDDRAISEILVYNLDKAGYEVSLAIDGRDGVSQAQLKLPDIILLDVMLPIIDGVEVCRRLRAKPETAGAIIIMLTAKTEEADQLIGFSVGADDYVTKPFSPKELLARIKAVMRRSGKLSEQGQLSVGDLTLDAEQHRLTIAGKTVDVSPTEFRLMQFFMTNPDKVYSRTHLLDQVWGRSVYIEERTVDVHIRRLRKLLAEFDREDLIQTVRGFGYRFSMAD
jgi:two-component system phosphate regulon response regulator PhoB